MPNYIYHCGVREKGKLPYLLSFWSGYYLATLALCAFAMLSQWFGSSVEVLSALLLAGVGSLLSGHLLGRYLALRSMPVSRLILLLIAGALLTLGPIMLGERLAVHAVRAHWTEQSAALALVGLLFAPSMVLLCAIPPYAATMLVRHRGNPGSISGTILLLTALGFGLGAIATADYLGTRLDAHAMMKALLTLSAILCILALLRHPPRRIRGF